MVSTAGYTHDDLLAELPGLHRYARHLVGTRSGVDPDDLVQDVVERALARADTFRGESSLRTWLHRMLHHRFLDVCRRDRSVPTEDADLMARIEASWRDDAYTVDLDAVLHRVEVGDDLRDALAHLPVPMRSAVLLHDVEGLTVAEIAAIQGIGLPAAKQRLRRGRTALVSLLDGQIDRRRPTPEVPLRCWKARSLIGDYLADELAPARRVAVETHLGACPTCPALYAALVGVRDAAGRLRGADDERDPNSVVPAPIADLVRARTAPPAADDRPGYDDSPTTPPPLPTRAPRAR